MSRHLALFLSLLILAPGVPILNAAVAGNPVVRQNATLPLRFEANTGQTDSATQFLARNGLGTVWLNAECAILHGRGSAAVRLRWVGGQALEPEPLDPLITRSNYFVGQDPARWRRDVPNFGRVRYRGVWPGIDLVYYGSGNQLEYDFVVAPGADPRTIGIAVETAGSIRPAANGDLELAPGVLQHRPRIYQQTPRGRVAISGRYVVEACNRVRFRVGRYDRRLPLVIDPTVAYATLFGGSGNDVSGGIAVDITSNAYITGSTDSSDLPAGVAGTRFQGTAPDVYVAKIMPDGTGLLYCTYLGGEGNDKGTAITVDANGNAYITGVTSSLRFPTTGGVLQPVYGGGGKSDAFAAKLGPSGNLLYATYLGGSGSEEGRAIAVDSSGNAYIAGVSSSLNFPLSATPYQARNKGGLWDGFVAKVNTLGTALVYSTLLGSSGDDEPAGIAVDSTGAAFVAGSTDGFDFPSTQFGFQGSAPNSTSTAFVVKLNPAGGALVYGTFVGGDTSDKATAIAVDASGNAYLAGTTSSSNFPVTDAAYQPTLSGASDAFVAKLDSTGSNLLYATLLGGTGKDVATAIQVDQSGNAYVAGDTTSTDFPTSSASFQPAPAGGAEAFVAKLDPEGTTLVYSSYIGGAGEDHATGLATDRFGDAYVVGTTLSPNFPVTPGALRATPGATDSFVVRVSDARFPSLVVDSLSLLFGYDVSQAAPPPRVLHLTSTAGALSFTATTTGGNWLSLESAKGTTPATLSVVVTPGSLSLGSYKGSIVIDVPGAANTPVTIPVQLDVSRALPAKPTVSVDPDTIPAGSGDTAVTISGTGFASNSVVQVNGVAVSTTHQGSSVVTALIPASMLAQPGTLTITVLNPPGANPVVQVTVNVTAVLPVISSGGVVNVASLASGPVAAGEVVLIQGSTLGADTPVQAPGTGAAPTTLGGTQVWFSQIAAPILYASANQVIAVAPFALAGAKSTQLQVVFQGNKSAVTTLDVAATAPGVFTAGATGSGQAAATNQDGSGNDAFTPAPAGTAITIMATGAGPTSPASVNGAISDGTPLLLQPVGVQIGGIDCQIVSAGPVAGLVNGFVAIKAVVPDGVDGAATLVVTIGGVPSQPGVTVVTQATQQPAQ
jgi:uncharacterized protein (TIGR03437 family)